MSHLHVPDGVLSPLLWGPALVVALLLLMAASRVERRAGPRQIAFRGALGALVLAVMSFPVPVGPVEFHLSLLGPVGVLLGPAAAFQLLFAVSAMLALVGHGGLTVVGVNALVLGAGASLARPVFRYSSARLGAGGGFAAAAVAAQGVSGLLWVAVVGAALRGHPAAADAHGHVERLELAGAVVAVLWVAGVTVESLVARGVGRFLARVKPELLPGVAGRAGSATVRA
jgi:cobalt/nickel transport system permease protein